jgi:hypothetical protein
MPNILNNRKGAWFSATQVSSGWLAPGSCLSGKAAGIPTRMAPKLEIVAQLFGMTHNLGWMFQWHWVAQYDINLEIGGINVAQYNDNYPHNSSHSANMKSQVCS